MHALMQQPDFAPTQLAVTNPEMDFEGRQHQVPCFVVKGTRLPQSGFPGYINKRLTVGTDWHTMLLFNDRAQVKGTDPDTSFPVSFLKSSHFNLLPFQGICDALKQGEELVPFESVDPSLVFSLLRHSDLLEEVANESKMRWLVLLHRPIYAPVPEAESGGRMGESVAKHPWYVGINFTSPGRVCLRAVRMSRQRHWPEDGYFAVVATH